MDRISMPPHSPEPLKKRRPALSQTQMELVEDRLRAERAEIKLIEFVSTRSLSRMESTDRRKDRHHRFKCTFSPRTLSSIKVDRTGIYGLRNGVTVERILPNKPALSVVAAGDVADRRENVPPSNPYPSPISDGTVFTACSECERRESLCVKKSVPKPENSFCDAEEIQTEMNYWDENVNYIENFIAPMEDQRCYFLLPI